MTRSTVHLEQTYYLPTCIVDSPRHEEPDPDGEHTLFLRHFTLVETPRGKQKLRVELDVEFFPNAKAMGDAIDERGLVELPQEADGDPLYVPEELRDDRVTVERSYGNQRNRRRYSREKGAKA